ncbi:GNAT family N-acetyltransferase [Marinobacterium litorale]|uniref:GNAT family N-acetyltransferase n=1 Tax=Marinobacterium litorale TaxID=404770 RepID=UPI00041DB736|nr:GNAT family N-acetyltransferase [Marinobacterium litorale]
MVEIKLHPAISEIPRSLWNGLCGTGNPFLRHEFLESLERSGSVSPENGWQPLHITLTEHNQCVGVMPLYLKSHSWGEYVFDWSWADAWERHGLDYYPKLVTAIPFTPSTGPRFGLAIEPERALPVLVEAVQQISARYGCSGWHGLFIEPHLVKDLKALALSTRLGTQYHWFNRNYRSFDDFLEQFSSRKRKNVRKEREKALLQGVELITLEGAEITEELLDQFYRFYQTTYLKRGMQGYLTRAFFSLLTEQMPENLIMVTAHHNHRVIAAALSLKDEDTLYGRYWGCLEEFDSLHFEACYYQGIDYCIANGLQRFDSGAQGEHKIKRGFEPIETWSAHWVETLAFRQAIDEFTREEEQQMRGHIRRLSEELPFRRDR